MSPDRPAAATLRAARSRDSHLTLRRVERQHRLIEILSAAGRPTPSAVLAATLGVGVRTVERDLARLREAGVPIEAVAGAHGGSRLPRRASPPAVRLSFSEIAALIASLVALGPTATDTSASAMQALVASITPAGDERAAGTVLGVSGSGRVRDE